MLATSLLCLLPIPQVPSAVVLESNLISTNEEIVGLFRASANSQGGWCTLLYVGDPTNARPVLYGSLDGGAPSVIAEPLTQGGTLLTNFRLGDTAPLFSSENAQSVTGCAAGLAGTYFGSQLLWCRGDTPPFGMDYDGSPLQLGLGPGDEPFLEVRSFAPSTGLVGGILSGTPLSPLLIPGDLLPGVATPVRDVFQMTVTPSTGDWVRALDWTTGTVTGTPLAVINGQPLMNDGAFVQDGELVDPSAGTGGARWFRVGQVAMDAEGSWWVSGLDNGPIARRAVVLKDGKVVMRQGDVVDGVVLEGNCRSLLPGADGSMAVFWDSEPDTSVLGFTVTRQSIFVDGKRVVWAGQRVDVDGDGIAEPDQVLDQNFISTLQWSSIDEDSVLRLVAKAYRRENGATIAREALFEVALPIGRSVCDGLPNSTGQSGTLSASGTARISANDLTLTAAQLPVGASGYLIGSQSPITGIVIGGNLCIGGSIGRFLDSLQPADGSGRIVYDVDATALAQPMGSVPAAPGDTWYFQLWHRDTSPSGVAVSEFTEARAVLWR